MADQIIEKSKTVGVVGEYSRFEKKIAKREALAAEQLRALGGEFKLGAGFFRADGEERAAEAEALAKASTDMLAKTPWIDIKNLSIAES